jgi:hypothetical protein
LAPQSWLAGRTGSILGTITDPDGRAVVNAPVEAHNIATASVYRATTSVSGNYTLAKLPVGTYTLVVPDVGFTLVRFERNGLLVQAAPSPRSNPTGT